ELAPNASLDALGRALQGLTLSSVKPVGALDGLTSETLVAATTFDGLRLDLRMQADAEGKWFATVEAAFDESLRPAGAESAEEGAEEGEAPASAEDVRKE